MTRARWWLLLDADGKVAQQICLPYHPVKGGDPDNDEAPVMAWPLDRVRETARPGDLETEVPKKDGWEAVPERVEAQQLRVLDSERQEAAAELLHPHPAIALAHARKSEEARSWLLLRGETLDAAEVQLLFPWLASEAEATGTSIDDLARTIVENRNKAEAGLREIDVAAIDAKRRLRAAPTAIGKRRVAKDWKGAE